MDHNSDYGRYIMHGHWCKALCMWSFVMLVLTSVNGFYCVRFIYRVMCWWSWCSETGTSSVDRARRQSPVSEMTLNKKQNNG
jgi:hypothetical protein